MNKISLEALEKGQLPPARLLDRLGLVNPSNVSHSWELILGTVAGLLPVINPLATTPTFLAITEGDSQERRLEQLRRACFYMVAILVGALVFGTFIMNAFGISIPGLRIAGGMLVAGIGWRMLLGPGTQTQHSEQATPAARAKPDVSFTPLAMPMLSGPGSIAVTIGFASLARVGSTTRRSYLEFRRRGISYATLRLSTRVVIVIGSNGMNALQAMGFLLVCVGIQFVVNGIIGVAAEPALVRAIRDALQPRP